MIGAREMNNIGFSNRCFTAPPGASVVKNLPASAGDTGLIHGLGGSPGVGNATHSSILAWKIPWTEESGGLESMVSQRFGHNLATKQ